MLEKQLEDLKPLDNRSLASRSAAIVLSDHDSNSNNNVTELASRVSVLEGLISSQNTTLKSLNATCKRLLEKKSSLVDKLDKALSHIENLQCARKDHMVDHHYKTETEIDHCDSCVAPPNLSALMHHTDLLPPGHAAGLWRREHSAECCEVILNGILKKNSEVSDEVRNVVLSEEAGATDGGLGSDSDASRSCVARLSRASLVRDVM